MRISMPRGDIRLQRFSVYNGDKTLCEIDFTEIYFTVKRKYSDSDYCFQKRLSTGGITKISTGNYQIKIMPEDTDGLTINTQNFPYYDADIQVQYNDEVKSTICVQFVLTKEVTSRENER